MNIVVVDEEYQYVEPLGLLFVIFFALVMFFQLIGMVMHRIMTLGHIVSTTNIGITRVGMIYMNTQKSCSSMLFLPRFGSEMTNLIQTKCSTMKVSK